MPSAPCLDGTAALSPVAAGMRQSGGKAFPWSRIPNFLQEHFNGSPEHVLKPSKKAIKVFRLGRSNQNPCRAKWLRFEAQAAEFETSQLSQDSQPACMGSSAFSGQYIEAKRTDDASRGSHMSGRQLDERQCDAGGSPPSHVFPSHAGHVHAEVDAVFTGNAPVWKEPFWGMKGADAGTEKPFEPSFDAGEHVNGSNRSASMTESHKISEVQAPQGSDVLHAACSDARAAYDCESAMHSCNGVQLVDMEDHHISFNHGGDGSTSHNQGLRAASFCTDGQMSRSMDGIRSHADKQGVCFEYGNGGEEALKPSMVGVDVKESITSPCKIVAVRMPTYRAPTYLQDSLRDSRCYLESLGADCVRLFQVEPTVMSCTLKQIKALVSALEGYGVECKDAGRIFNLCPKVLLLDPEKDLEVVTSFLFNEAGLSPKDFRKVIRRCPRLLVLDLDTDLRPTLSFLRTLGFARMGHAIANNPTLLSYNVESRMLPRLRLLESWGFTYREAAAMVVRFPALFNYSAVENLQCKYDYLVHEIKAGKKDLLAFPQYFGYSLESRIRPRHQRIAKLNVPLSIQAMLTLSNIEFNAKFSSVHGAWSMRREEEVGGSLYESKLHDSNRGFSKSTSFENPEAQVLVSV